MRKSSIFVLVTFFIIALSCNSVLAQEKKGAKLKFEKESEQLGTLVTNELEPMKIKIEFENEGDEPLVLSYVRGCCGTRINDWTKEPIMPGEKGMIEAECRFAPRPQKVSRTVSVMSNDPAGMKVFRILGEVVDPKAEEPFGANINKGAAPRVR
ncbi:MAG: DUF1573 domain-containing protein [Bacteroidales bacterium]|nr:DUF1573 domain-containing protein [Bacteroidales bacterium]